MHIHIPLGKHEIQPKYYMFEPQSELSRVRSLSGQNISDEQTYHNVKCRQHLSFVIVVACNCQGLTEQFIFE